MTTTSASDDSGFHAARGDGAAQLRVVAAWLVVGVVLGALVGGFVGASRPTTYQAVTAVSSLPDSAVASGVGESNDAATSDDVSSFIQGELVALNGASLRRQVQQKLRLRQLPDVSASQVGMTDVINIAATSASRAQSLRIATALANAYKARRSAELRSDVGTALSLVQQQISALRKSLTGTGSTASSTTALRSQEASLLGQETSLQLSAAAESRAVQVVQPADISTPGLSKTVTYSLVGALLGAILLLLTLLGWRQVRPRVRSTSDLDAVTGLVISPAFPRRRRRSGHNTDAAARLLTSRLSTSTGPEVVVCVGTGRRVGTSFVAARIADQLAETNHVLLIRAASTMYVDEHRQRGALQLEDLVNGERSVETVATAIAPNDDGVDILECGPPGRSSVRTMNNALRAGLIPAVVAAGWAVVIDAPALDSSSLGAELATHGDAVVLVVGRGRSRAADVEAGLNVLHVRGARVLGVLLNNPATNKLRRRVTPQEPPGPTLNSDLQASDDSIQLPESDEPANESEPTEQERRPAMPEAREDAKSPDPALVLHVATPEPVRTRKVTVKRDGTAARRRTPRARSASGATPSES